MKVKVRYFSIAKDASGVEAEEVELPFGSDVSGLLQRLKAIHPHLLDIEGLLVLVNGRPVPETTKLREEDEVAVIPPVSGGGIMKDEIDLNEEVRRIGKGAGAVVVFVGFVKASVDGKVVKELEYEAYEPYATEKISEIEEEIKGVKEVKIYHRIGKLKPGEPTIYILVSADGRREAFEGAREALERVKHEVPIFKLERREDGEYWVIGDGKRVKRLRP